mmetsp:Transcript_74047/g.239391  ORF Transcript_74047/g.239391 Transcript_74047/m.239391 type:complete len:266 (+) Transcript_74047:71-868(+)
MIHGLLDQIQPDASDEEDDEQPGANFVFQANMEGDSAGAVSPGDCCAVVVCCPGAASAFALSAFTLQPVPWLLDFAKDGPAPLTFPPCKPQRFHVSREGPKPAAVVLLDGPVPAESAAAWAEALLAAFPGASEVIVLDRVFRAGWRTSCGRERPLEPHLCGLWTAAWGAAGPPGSGAALAQLPAPNVVEGLGAALLTECEALGRRCLLALALQDGVHLGESCVRAFAGLTPVLQGVGLLPVSWKEPDYSQGLHQVLPPMSMSIYA